MTYANVMVTLLAFVVLGGGTALASYVVTSNDEIAPGTVSGHSPPSGNHPNLIPRSINGLDVEDGSIGLHDVNSLIRSRLPKRIDFVHSVPGGSRHFLISNTDGRYTISISCSADGMSVSAVLPQNRATARATYDSMWVTEGSSKAHTLHFRAPPFERFVEVARMRGAGTGLIIGRDSFQTITIPFHYVLTSHRCHFFGTSTATEVNAGA